MVDITDVPQRHALIVRLGPLMLVRKYGAHVISIFNLARGSAQHYFAEQAVLIAR